MVRIKVWWANLLTPDRILILTLLGVLGVVLVLPWVLKAVLYYYTWVLS